MPKKKTKRRKPPPPPKLYAADRTFGLLLCVFSMFGTCWGAFAAMFGSAFSRAGSGHSSIGTWQLLICGILSSVTSVVLVFAAILIMGSTRRGFMLAVWCSVVNICLGLLSLPYGAIEIVSGLVVIYFCRQRISGKQGPKLDN